MPSCPSCGLDVNPRSRSCGACGARLDLSRTPTRLQSPSPPTRPLSPPQVLQAPRFAVGVVLSQRYRIVNLLGRGGMGEVYRAEDLSLDQPVALKFLPREMADDPQWLERIRGEVRLARQVSHSNVCRVHDIGEVEGQTCLSMEYIDGEDLAALLRRIGRLPRERGWEIARQICAGLAAAHAAGVLHRDLKPANIMLDSHGRVRITDFGLAAPGSDSAGDHEVVGTPSYMAPEQVAGRGASEKSDIFALGLVLFELATGRRAQRGSSLAEIRREHRNRRPPAPSELIPEIDPNLDSLIGRCLAWAPEHRPTAMEALTILSGGNPVGAALAAGQTPSPGAVAALPAQGSLRPLHALICLLGVVAAVLLWQIAGHGIMVLGPRTLDLPPDALQARAREVITAMRVHSPAADSARGFVFDEVALNSCDAPPGPVRFWYRQSPVPLVAGTTSGRVDLDDPAPTAPGMASVLLDSRGRLLRAVVVPGRDPPAESREPHLQPLLRLAGLELAEVRAVQPRWLPAVYADTRQAWVGPDVLVPGRILRLEAAVLAGHPVAVEVFAERQGEVLVSAPLRAHASRTTGGIWEIFSVILLLVGVVLARHNLRRGRGDRAGAAAVALVVLGLELLHWLLTADHVGSPAAEVILLIGASGSALYLALSLWVYYLALEPWVRRLWPESLVSWARLMAGSTGDAMVARDCLVGVLAAAVSRAAMAVIIVVGNTLSPEAANPLLTWTDPLLGVRHSLASLLAAPGLGIQAGLVFLLLMLLLRVTLRRQRLTGVLLVLCLSALLFAVVSGLFGGAQPVWFVVVATTVTLWVVVLTRFGLLALVTMIVLQIIGAFGAAFVDPSAWYAAYPLFTTALSLGLALWGFFGAIGDQPLLRADPLD